jgi:septal ring factor EnvC (AmiA/AmiB activator)
MIRNPALNLKATVFNLIYFCLLTAASAMVVAQSEAEYEQQLKELAVTIEKLKQELSKTKTSRDKLQKSLQNSEEEISDLTTKIENIKEALAREKKQLIQYQRQRTELETSKKSQQQQINQVITQAYQLGQQSQIKMLLNQEAPHKIKRLMRYHEYFVAAHKEKIDAFLTTIDSIKNTENRIVETTTRLESHQQSLAERFQDLKDSQRQRLATLASLNKDLQSKGDTLSQLRGDRQRLEKLLEQATLALSKIKLPGDAVPFHTTRGKLPFPTRGKIAKRFGSSILNGKLRWKGLFISGKSGDPVISVHHGRVIFSDYLRGHGLLLIIDHGNGYMSLYAHNQTLLKETGDWVSSNEPIARLGNTGGQEQAGLYFEIRLNGKPIDPINWLKRKS